MNEANSYTLIAKLEFSKHLTYTLYPPLYMGIKQIWETAKREAKEGHVYETFQRHLKLIPKWNQDLIDSVYHGVLENIRFEGVSASNNGRMLDDLITKVFILSTEILAAPFTDEKIMVKVPPGSRFLHHCYKECARHFYENAFLLEDRPQFISRIEQVKNLQKANKAIVACIENAVRRLLPMEALTQSMSERPRAVEPGAAPSNLPGEPGRYRSESRGRRSVRSNTLPAASSRSREKSPGSKHKERSGERSRAESAHRERESAQRESAQRESAQRDTEREGGAAHDRTSTPDLFSDTDDALQGTPEPPQADAPQTVAGRDPIDDADPEPAEFSESDPDSSGADDSVLTVRFAEKAKDANSEDSTGDSEVGVNLRSDEGPRGSVLDTGDLPAIEEKSGLQEDAFPSKSAAATPDGRDVDSLDFFED
jgi:hypothetical protein